MKTTIGTREGVCGVCFKQNWVNIYCHLCDSCFCEQAKICEECGNLSIDTCPNCQEIGQEQKLV